MLFCAGEKINKNNGFFAPVPDELIEEIILCVGTPEKQNGIFEAQNIGKNISTLGRVNKKFYELVNKEDIVKKLSYNLVASKIVDNGIIGSAYLNTPASIKFLKDQFNDKKSTDSSDNRVKARLFVGDYLNTMGIDKKNQEKQFAVMALEKAGISSIIIAINRDVDDTYTDVISKLLEKKIANVNTLDYSGTTPLIVATKWLLKDAIELLLKEGARINGSNAAGNTVLHKVVKMVHPKKKRQHRILELIELFIKNGINTTLKNNEGKTAFDLAKNISATYTEKDNAGYTFYATIRTDDKTKATKEKVIKLLESAQKNKN